MTDALFTIGHSTHAIDYFLTLLLQHEITLLADVRSVPMSRYNPQFNRESLKASLAGVGINYIYLGLELGGHPHDPACYRNGKVSYELMLKTRLFQKGLTKLADTMRLEATAIVCAEKDPLNCHRTHLVSRALDAEGLAIQHILADGSLVTHTELMTPQRRQAGLF